MNEDLKKYIAENKKSRSFLDEFEDEIMAMREAGLSFGLIVKYLFEKKKLKTNISNVSQWYKRRTTLKTQTVVINTKNVKVSSSDELDPLKTQKPKGGKEDTKGKDNKVVFSSQDENKKEDEKSPSIISKEIVAEKQEYDMLENVKRSMASIKEIEARYKK